jgi:DNA-damage-inducible protein J
VAAADVVRARVESGLKNEASTVLSEMGLSVSDAIRLLLVRVVADRALPFDVRVPNKATEAAMRDAREGMVKHAGSVAELMDALNSDEDE